MHEIMIDPNNITTVRVDQLGDGELTLSKLIPFAEENGDLKKATIQAFADLVATTIGATDAVGFLPLSVTDGQQLPDVPEVPKFFLCGSGTYLNVNGYPDVICTGQLNAVMSLSDHWAVAVEIPISLTVIGFTPVNIYVGFLDDVSNVTVPTGFVLTRVVSLSDINTPFTATVTGTTLAITSGVSGDIYLIDGYI